jgi:hypothetical protein
LQSSGKTSFLAVPFGIHRIETVSQGSNTILANVELAGLNPLEVFQRRTSVVTKCRTENAAARRNNIGAA